MQHLVMSTATARARAARYRQSMRDQGYRLIQAWVPDVRTDAFAAAAHAQSAAVASSPSAQEDQDLIEAVSAPWDSWEE